MKKRALCRLPRYLHVWIFFGCVQERVALLSSCIWWFYKLVALTTFLWRAWFMLVYLFFGSCRKCGKHVAPGISFAVVSALAAWLDDLRATGMPPRKQVLISRTDSSYLCVPRRAVTCCAPSVSIIAALWVEYARRCVAGGRVPSWKRSRFGLRSERAEFSSTK